MEELKQPDAESETLFRLLGFAIEEIYRLGMQRVPVEVPFAELMKKVMADETSTEFLRGAFSILHILGLITFTPDNFIRVTSRQARFTLGSLAKFCSGTVQVVDETLNEEYESVYLVELTKALESTRAYKMGIDKRPLHERKLVNVLIKGRQIRDGQKQDVYLHVYHPKWQAYHLVGIGYRQDMNSSDDAVHFALEQKVNLLRHQYELDNMIKVDGIEDVYLSESLGVLTKYIISIRVVRKINVDLNLVNKIRSNPKWNEDTFKWFTLSEINQGYGYHRETIMRSSALVFKTIDSASIPISINQAKDTNRWPRLSDVVNSKFTKTQQFIIGLVGLLALLLALQPHIFLSVFAIPESQLPIYANYAQVIGTIISIASLLITVFKSTRD